jgi:hypothetical protein
MTHSRFWLVSIASATALAACAQEPPAPALGRVQQQAVAVQVDGYQPNQPEPDLGWVDTLLDVESGDHLFVRCVGGLIAPWGIDPIFDCNGDAVSPPWHESIAPQCSFGSLVGKIGRDGAPFCLGAEHDRPMTENGRLYLGFNDGVSFEDNAGSWSVDVEIDGPTSDWTGTTYLGCPAWSWNQDPDLLVVLPDDACWSAAGLIYGLHFVRGTNVHATEVGGLLFPPILSMVPPESGQPLLSDNGSLTLQLDSLINDEHCGSEHTYNHPYVDVSPRLLEGGSIEITTTIEGMTYLGLPPDGSVEVAARQEFVQSSQPSCGTADQTSFSIDPATLATKTWYCGMSSFTAANTSLGTLQFSVLSPAELPDVHFEPRSDTPGGLWIEFDVDHSCLESAPVLRLISRVP